MRNSIVLSSVSTLAFALAVGCSSSTHSSAPPASPSGTATPIASASPAPADACAGITVFFDTESDELDLVAEKRLDELAACLGDKTVHEIVVSGRADPTGNSKNNDALSMKRAEKVVAALEKRGVATEMLLIHAYGESDASHLKVMWPYERRADVKVTTTPPSDDVDQD